MTDQLDDEGAQRQRKRGRATRAESQPPYDRNTFKTTDGPRPSVEQALRECEAAFQEMCEIYWQLCAEDDKAAPVETMQAAHGSKAAGQQGDATVPGGKADMADDKAPDWDAPITLAEAALISGLSAKHLRNMAMLGTLKTAKVGARLHTTTRRNLDAYLRSRGTRHKGPAPKPLPADYQAPPRRGRPPKPRSTAGDAQNGE